MTIGLVKDSSVRRPVDQLWPPCPSEGIPKNGVHALAVCITPGQLEYFAALALQQHGQQSALRKGRGGFCHDVSPFLMAYVIVRWVSTLCSERYEFHKPVFLFGLTAPNPRGTRNHLHGALSTAASLQVTRGSS